MSIQGSVNQLFTIGGSFAGMYGLLHPEIQEGRQLMKDVKSRSKYIDAYLSKDDDTRVDEMSKEQLNEYEDNIDMAEEAVEKIYSEVHKNPSLLKNKGIKKEYDDIVRMGEEIRYDDLREEIADRREVLNKPNIPKRIKVVPKVKAQTELQTEGMQKVQQNANYDQRRKDKGDV